MKFFYIPMLLLGCGVSYSQTNTSIITADGKTVGIVDNIRGAIVPVIKPANVEGSPFLYEDWIKGTVFFKKGKRADSLPIKFDLQNNVLYFKQDSVIMTFLEEVSSFWLTGYENDQIKTVYFKNNYPLTGQLNPATFFEIEVEGPAYHLLRHLSKNIAEEYSYNNPAKRRFQLTTDWYVYEVAGDKMEKIKLNRTAIIKKLPGVSLKIEDLCKKNNWGLKTEDEIIKLFLELNK